MDSKDNKTPTSTTFLAMISAAVGTALVSFFAFLSTFAALSPLLTCAGFASPFAALAIAVVRRGRVVKERKGNEKPVKVPGGEGRWAEEVRDASAKTFGKSTLIGIDQVARGFSDG